MPAGGIPRAQRQRLVAGLLAFVAVSKFSVSLHKRKHKALGAR